MKKFIRPFESELLNINEEESLKSKQSQLFLSPEEFEEIESRNKEIVKKSVGEKLEAELNEYWNQKKEMEKLMYSLKNNLDDSYNKMLKSVQENIAELEKHGIEIENGNIEFDNIVLKISEKEKMYHFSDGDKLKVFEMLEELEEKKISTIKAYARSIGMINEFFEYMEMGIFYKKEQGSERSREPYFRYAKVSPEVSESVAGEGNVQSIISKVSNFFKNAWYGIKKYGYLFGLEKNISEYKTKLKEANALIDRL
jgi:hypothetical protein